MIGFEAFLSKILPRVEGAPRPAVNDAIRVAVQEFCQRTRLWRGVDTIHIVSLEEGIIAAEHGAVIYEIESARFNGYNLEPASITWLDGTKEGWRTWGDGQPKYITQTEPDTVLLVPGGIGTLELSTFLKPSEDATVFPDFIADHYKQIIADGALAELYMQPGQPYSSAELAMFHSTRFERRLDGMNSDSVKGQQRARVRTKPFFF